MVKVPVEDLLGYNDSEYARYAESKLVFASLASKEDAVLTVVKENKNKSPKVVMRVDSLLLFDEGKLMDGGETPFNEGLGSEVLAFDVIPHEHLQDFKGVLDMSKKMLGHPNNSTTKGMVNKLHLWGITAI